MVIDKKFQKGFTLLELLVTIGILGILAATLVALIDPLEQFNKAQDANMKNAAAEYVAANVRYYASHNNLPWAPATAGGDASCYASNATPPVTVTLSNGTITPCITALINDGELKSSFTTATSILNSVVISATTNTVTACFQPQSKSQKKDTNTIYAQNGTVTSGCAAQTSGGSTTCYWCAR
jgi:prepilin-type N-terminal cleavage/methylation domain-containing protein